MNDDLVGLVTTARFTPVFRQGYAMEPVDEFLDRLVQQLAAGRPVAPMIEAHWFPLASWTEAYERDEVDLLLAQVKHHAVVVEQAADEPEPEAEPETEPVAGAPRVPHPRTESAGAGANAGAGEKKGVLIRLFGPR